MTTKTKNFTYELKQFNRADLLMNIGLIAKEIGVFKFPYAEKKDDNWGTFLEYKGNGVIYAQVQPHLVERTWLRLGELYEAVEARYPFITQLVVASAKQPCMMPLNEAEITYEMERYYHRVYQASYFPELQLAIAINKRPNKKIRTIRQQINPPV